MLLEAFDEADLELARDLTARRAAGGADGRGAPILIGVNSRDLQTLKVRAGALRGAGAAAAGRLAGGGRERRRNGRRCAAHAAARAIGWR